MTGLAAYTCRRCLSDTYLLQRSGLLRQAAPFARSSSSSLVSSSKGANLIASPPTFLRSHNLSTYTPRRRPSDDPGGKPNDGRHPTVYDDFKNITASDEPTMSIHSMGDSSFTLSDGLIIHTPMIVLNKQVILWDAPDLSPTFEKPIMPNGIGWEAWTDDAWRIFEMVSPRPEIIIFGTGKTVLPPPAKLKKYLNTLGIQIEAHDTRNACSTYNLLAEEDRLVAAALLPPQRKPTHRVKATDTAPA